MVAISRRYQQELSPSGALNTCAQSCDNSRHPKHGNDRKSVTCRAGPNRPVQSSATALDLRVGIMAVDDCFSSLDVVAHSIKAPCKPPEPTCASQTRDDSSPSGAEQLVRPFLAHTRQVLALHRCTSVWKSTVYVLMCLPPYWQHSE